MFHKLLLTLALLAATAFPFAAPVPDAAVRVPTVDDLLNLRTVGSPP